VSVPCLSIRAFALLLCIALCACSKPTGISGEVVNDFDNANLVGQEVKLKGTAYSTTTDELGRFRFLEIAEGSYELLLPGQRHDPVNVNVSKGVVTQAERIRAVPEPPGAKNGLYYFDAVGRLAGVPVSVWDHHSGYHAKAGEVPSVSKYDLTTLFFFGSAGAPEAKRLYLGSRSPGCQVTVMGCARGVGPVPSDKASAIRHPGNTWELAWSKPAQSNGKVLVQVKSNQTLLGETTHYLFEAK